MKTKFYFFGIAMGKKVFFINDPIIIDGNYLIDLNEHSLEMFFKNDKFVGLVKKNRGVLFGINSRDLTKFLKLGKMLSPDIVKKYVSVYFLNDEKLILFKINKVFYTCGEIKRAVWRILNPLKIISKREFEKITEDLKRHDYVNISFSCETKNFKLCIASFYHSFLSIKPKNYSRLKSKIKKLYKGSVQCSA